MFQTLWSKYLLSRCVNFTLSTFSIFQFLEIKIVDTESKKVL